MRRIQGAWQKHISSKDTFQKIQSDGEYMEGCLWKENKAEKDSLQVFPQLVKIGYFHYILLR